MNSIEWINKLLIWYDFYGRKLYWRVNELNLYQWLVLEILLRRSKAEKVNEICCQFFGKYKSPQDILNVSNDELSEDLKKIGYHKKRCIILTDVSRELIKGHAGRVPKKFDELCSIKHIGIYIASAFLTFTGNSNDEVCIDTNVIRIISRYYKIPVKNDNRSDTIIRAVIKNIAPKDKFKELNYALLDLGGTICIPQKPKCDECPINEKCCFYIGLKVNND